MGWAALPHAVRAALNDGADVDHHAVHRKGVGAQICHDLAVEEHGQDTHGHIDEEGGKSGDHDLPQLAKKGRRSDQTQGVPLGEEMAQHDHKGDGRADGGGQTRAENAHVAGEHEEVVAEYIEKPTGQYRRRGQGGRAVVAQEGGQHLVEQEQGNGEFDGQQIGLPGGAESPPREQTQQRRVETGHSQPAQGGQYDDPQQSRGEIRLALLRFCPCPGRC